jgi:hypothetical protein
VSDGDDDGDDESDGCELSAAVSGLGDAEAYVRPLINKENTHQSCARDQETEQS